jgi:hypothetical protein
MLAELFAPPVVFLVCLFAVVAAVGKPTMLTEDAPIAVLASVTLAQMLTNAASLAFLALAPSPFVHADTTATAIFALVSLPVVFADATPPTFLTAMPLALMDADAAPPTVLALAPTAVVLTAPLFPAPNAQHPVHHLSFTHSPHLFWLRVARSATDLADVPLLPINRTA